MGSFNFPVKHQFASLKIKLNKKIFTSPIFQVDKMDSFLYYPQFFLNFSLFVNLIELNLKKNEDTND